MLGWVLLIVGGTICLLNVYLSFLRYPLHRALGRKRESYRWVSGIPILGSMTLVLAWTFWTRHQESLAIDVAVASLALLDTGGIHWFVGTMAYERLQNRGKTGA